MGPVVNKKVAAITYVYQSVYLLLLTGLLVYVVNVIFHDYLDKQKKRLSMPQIYLHAGIILIYVYQKQSYL